MTSTTAPARPLRGLALASLLRADLAVLRRSWRLQVLSLGLPILVLVASQQGHQGKPVGADTVATLISTALIVGPMAVGVFGYPLALARDRESGVFQRLRVTPVPTWTIMGSRLVLQVALNIVVTLAVAGIGAVMFKVPLGTTAYVLLIPAAILSGAVFLGLGQAIVGLLTSTTQVNAVGRLVYIALLLGDVLGLSGGLGPSVRNVARWSPVGSTESLFHTALIHSGWTTTDTNAALACLGYILIFSILGIRYFRWDTH